MIRYLNIINFESHPDTQLEFEPGLNVFVGESDRGKSGVFRAFNWVRTNRPLGDGMRPLYWEGETEVGVGFDQGQEATRKKGKANHYFLTDSENYQEWNAGTEVPAEVQRAFSMGDVNFQSQIDRAFLMFDTPGERGRTLNQVAGLDKIDSTMSAANSDILRLRRKSEQLTAAADGLEVQLERYERLPDLQLVVEQLEALEKMIGQARSEISRASDLYRSRTEVLVKLDPLEALESRAEPLWKDLIVTSTDYFDLKSKYGQVVDKFLQSKVVRRETPDHLALSGATELLEQAEFDLGKMTGLNKEINGAWALINKRKMRQEDLRDMDGEILRLEKDLPDECPTCGAQIGGQR
jgi:DNA repair exonuclease SbcCD ATPase subunit